MDLEILDIPTNEIDSERVSKEHILIKKILGAAHHLFKAEIEARPIIEALKSDDKEYLKKELQKQINKYRNSIDMLSGTTKIKVITVKPDFYDEKNVDYIKNNLRFIINIIYIRTAIKFGLEKLVVKALEKMAIKQEENNG